MKLAIATVYLYATNIKKGDSFILFELEELKQFIDGEELMLEYEKLALEDGVDGFVLDNKGEPIQIYDKEYILK